MIDLFWHDLTFYARGLSQTLSWEINSHKISFHAHFFFNFNVSIHFSYFSKVNDSLLKVLIDGKQNFISFRLFFKSFSNSYILFDYFTNELFRIIFSFSSSHCLFYVSVSSLCLFKLRRTFSPSVSTFSHKNIKKFLHMARLRTLQVVFVLFNL